MEQLVHAATQHAPWNKGKLVGQKAPLKLKDIWALRVGNRTRELALFNLAIDSKLRSCDLVKLRVRDVCHGSAVAPRAMVMQQKTQRRVQFEITEQTRESLLGRRVLERAQGATRHARACHHGRYLPSTTSQSLRLAMPLQSQSSSD
jgi:hypothetical protein